MPTPAAYTIYAFGITAFIAGLSNLLFGNSALDNFGLPDACLPAMYGNALAAIAMGIYYTLAAYQENHLFFALTVPMRTLTAVIFWRLGGPWKPAGVWEGFGAALTGLALVGSHHVRRDKK
jgi:hypothetical protein